MVRSLTLVCAALVFACIASRPALGQVNAGSILVKAVDEQRSVMPGVTVVITSPVLLTGEQSAVTDSRGTSRFTPFLPSVYSVRFELTGFQTLIRGMSS